jgi:hypothetical protein
MGGMGLLVVFILILVLGEGLVILLGLTVERLFSPYTGLITFIILYFATFWFAWKAAVWLTEPGKRLTKLFGGAAERGLEDRPSETR